MLVDGEVVRTVERDFESLHMQLVYRRAGKAMHAGDLYAVDGFTRKLAKVATLVSLNADGTEVGAITGILEKDEDLPERQVEAVMDREHMTPAEHKAAVARFVQDLSEKTGVHIDAEEVGEGLQQRMVPRPRTQ